MNVTVCVALSAFIHVTLPPEAIVTTCGLNAKFRIVTLAVAGTGEAVGAGVGVGVAAGAAVGVAFVGMAVGVAVTGTAAGDAVGELPAAGAGVAVAAGVGVGDEHPARTVASRASAIIAMREVRGFTLGSQVHIIQGFYILEGH